MVLHEEQPSRIIIDRWAPLMPSLGATAKYRVGAPLRVTTAGCSENAWKESPRRIRVASPPNLAAPCGRCQLVGDRDSVVKTRDRGLHQDLSAIVVRRLTDRA